MAIRYYARGKRVASESTGVYGDEWVCTMDGDHDAKWMALQLNRAEASVTLASFVYSYFNPADLPPSVLEAVRLFDGSLTYDGSVKA